MAVPTARLDDRCQWQCARACYVSRDAEKHKDREVGDGDKGDCSEMLRFPAAYDRRSRRLLKQHVNTHKSAPFNGALRMKD